MTNVCIEPYGFDRPWNGFLHKPTHSHTHTAIEMEYNVYKFQLVWALKCKIFKISVKF